MYNVFILSNKFQNLARRRWKLATNLGLTGWSSPTLNLIVMLPLPPLAKSSWLVLAVSPQVGPGLVSAKFYLANLLTNTIITALICSGSWWESSVMVGCVLLMSLSLVTPGTGTLHANNGQSTQKMPVSVLVSSYLRHNMLYGGN